MIEVRALHKRHGSLEVLRGVSLTVERGEVAAIVGPSGGGKSTLLRCINGLESFEQGEVRVGDRVMPPKVHERDHAALLRAVRSRVGMVFQQFHLFPHLDVMSNITEAPVRVLGTGRDAARAEAHALLAKVGLSTKAASFPHQLSGGQQQRVAIARALAMHPEVLLLDEPTSALDPLMASEVMAVIADLARGGQTMLVVTHQLGLVRAIANTVHVFAEGQCAEHGPVTQVFEAPAHPVTRSFLKNE